jgi:hypothetical protein
MDRSLCYILAICACIFYASRSQVTWLPKWWFLCVCVGRKTRLLKCKSIFLASNSFYPLLLGFFWKIAVYTGHYQIFMRLSCTNNGFKIICERGIVCTMCLSFYFAWCESNNKLGWKSDGVPSKWSKKKVQKKEEHSNRIIYVSWALSFREMISSKGNRGMAGTSSSWTVVYEIVGWVE